MKKIILCLLALTVFAGSVSAKKDKTPGYDYELSLVMENVASTSGYKVFKVWSYTKKKETITQEINMRNAVHGILFKGLAAADEGSQGNVPAMVPDGYDNFKGYFDNFFGSGEFKQFVQLTSKGAQKAGDVVKVGKQYKVGLLVQVNVTALRKRLERDGIVRSATDIFKR